MDNFVITRWEDLMKEDAEKHADKIDWCSISAQLSTVEFSEEFLESCASKFGWDYISKQRLSEKFIEKYASKVNWNYISEYQKLSESFIERHANEVNWDIILRCQNVSESFIASHVEFSEAYDSEYDVIDSSSTIKQPNEPKIER